MRTNRTAWLIATVLASCTVELPSPEGAQIRCVSDADCPGDLVCVAELDRCLPTGSSCIVTTSDGFEPAIDGNRCEPEEAPDRPGVCIGGACEVSRCGDGVLDTDNDESCDDGDANADASDACRIDCSLPTCGDGIRDGTELCDDGNLVDEDDCLNSCVTNVCGDAVPHPPAEPCDDGNASDNDACLQTCTPNTCGDTILNPAAEDCDDGNSNPNDGCDSCVATAWSAALLLGLGDAGGDPEQLWLEDPESVAADYDGNVFVADMAGHRVWRYDAASQLVTVAAGDGTAGFSGDNRPAAVARLNSPIGVAVDLVGNLYVADSENMRVRHIDPRGIIRTIAGAGGETLSGSGGPAILADIGRANRLALDGAGRVWFTHRNYGALHRIETDGTLTLLDFGCMPVCSGLVATPDDSFILTANTSHEVRERTSDGTYTVIAGVGTAGFSGDGGPATAAELSNPYGVTRAADGSILLADTDNHRIRRIDPTGTINTIAGIGSGAFSGDGGPATAAELHGPTDVSLDGAGNLYVADALNHRVRRIDASGTISTLIGSATGPRSGDGGPATSATLRPQEFFHVPLFFGVATDAAGNLYIADAGNARVRRVDTQGVISNVAGNGVRGTTIPGGHATDTCLSVPSDVAVDGSGNLYIADPYQYSVFRVDPAGVLSRFAGTGTQGFAGDSGPADEAELGLPMGLEWAAGELFIADTGNNRIRVVESGGTIRTYAGDGNATFAGDGLAPTAASLNGPADIAMTSTGLVIADSANSRVRLVSGNVMSTLAGDGQELSGGDGGPASDASIWNPLSIAVGCDGEVFVSGFLGNRVRVISSTLASATIRTLIGDDTPGFAGDGGTAANASLSLPMDLAVACSGTATTLYIAEGGSSVIRSIDVDSDRVVTAAGLIHPGDGAFGRSTLGNASAIVAGTRADTLLVAGGISGRVREVDLASGQVRTVAGYPGGFGDSASPSASAAYSRLFEDAAGVAYDAQDGFIYVAEAGGHVVRRITVTDPLDPSTWTIGPFAGVYGTAGRECCALTDALFDAPAGFAFDATTGTLYVADRGNHAVYALDVAAQTAAVFAGIPGQRGFLGDGILATAAVFDGPTALALAADGSLYVADTNNHRVRHVRGDGTVVTVIGDGSPSSSGNGSPAAYFAVDSPSGLAVDAFGNLFIASRTTIRRVAAGASGMASPQSSVATLFGLPPRDTFPASISRCLSGIYVEPGDASLLVLDACQGLLMRLTRDAAP